MNDKILDITNSLVSISSNTKVYTYGNVIRYSIYSNNDIYNPSSFIKFTVTRNGTTVEVYNVDTDPGYSSHHKEVNDRYGHVIIGDNHYGCNFNYKFRLYDSSIYDNLSKCITKAVSNPYVEVELQLSPTTTMHEWIYDTTINLDLQDDVPAQVINSSTLSLSEFKLNYTKFIRKQYYSRTTPTGWFHIPSDTININNTMYLVTYHIYDMAPDDSVALYVEIKISNKVNK